jgi:hypothetical protein
LFVVYARSVSEYPEVVPVSLRATAKRLLAVKQGAFRLTRKDNWCFDSSPSGCFWVNLSSSGCPFRDLFEEFRGTAELFEMISAALLDARQAFFNIQ